MTKFILSYKSIITLLTPLIVLHYFSSHFYHISLWDVIRWWITNITIINNAFPILLGLFFTLLVYFLSISGLVNILFLSVSGKKQELVYLGHISEDKAAYYNIDDSSQKFITGHDVEKKYNFSFNNLYRSQMFLIDKNSKGIGTKANRLHVFSFLSSVVGFIAFTLTTLIIFNILIHATYASNPVGVNLPTESALMAFDTIINKFGFSREGYFILMAGLMLLWLGLNIATPKNKISAQIEVLPPHIMDGKTIQGIPNDIAARYVKQRRSTDSSSYDYVDSGERYINYAFKNGFKHTVYVSTLIDLKNNAEIIKDIENNISNKKPMDLILDKDFNIQVVA